jgi:hypothetical protein
VDPEPPAEAIPGEEERRDDQDGFDRIIQAESQSNEGE